MSKSDAQHALAQAEGTLMLMKVKRSHAAEQLEQTEHNIAMLLVTITELRAVIAMQDAGILLD